MGRHLPYHPGLTCFRQNVRHHPRFVTVADLARKIGVTREHLSKVLRGHADITLSVALRIAEALGADMTTLTGTKVPRKRRKP